MGHRQPAPAFSLWLNFKLCPLQLYLSWLLKNQRLALFPPTLNCNRLPWLRQRYFLLTVFDFWSACFGPSVFTAHSACFVSQFSLPLRIYSFQFSRFLRSSRIFYSWLFIVLYTFVLLCTLPVLRKFFLHCPVYLLCLARIFLSWVFVALRFVCEIQGFFIVFCTFCLRVCKFPVFSKFGDTAL